jgi:hypothetical protein
MYDDNEAENNHNDKDELLSDGLNKQSRYYYVDFMLKAGYLLEVPQTTTATGIFYFHKFCAAFQKYDKQLVAVACMFLACKVDENVRRLRDVINVMYRIQSPEKEPLSLLDKEYLRMKDIISDHEQIILRALMFNVRVRLPYKYLVNYVACLQGSEGLLQLSYAIVNDSFRTTLCLRHKPNDIAAAAIYLASRMCGITLPFSEDEPQQKQVKIGEKNETVTITTRPWYHLFQTTRQTILDIIFELESMYRDHQVY